MKIDKFIIPVIDTEHGTFEYKGGEISQEEYLNMIRNRVRNTYGQITDLTNRLYGQYPQYGYSLNPGNIYIDKRDIVDKNFVQKYDYTESICVVTDAKGNEINEEFLDGKVNEGAKKFLLKFNIIESTMNQNAISEMLYWMEDSRRCLNDEEIDNRTCVMSLPTMNFYIDLETNDRQDAPVYKLVGCKIIKIFNIKDKPFCFIGLVSEIKKQ